MIFFAVAAPIPGRASSCCWLAVFTSTFSARAGRAGAAAWLDPAAVARDSAGEDAAAFAGAFSARDGAFSALVFAVEPTVRRDLSFDTVEAGTPALARSSTEP